MKKYLYLLVIVALLSLAGWTSYARGQRTNSMRQTWEYRVDPVPGTARIELLAEGWELTAVGGTMYYFRRAR